MSLCEKCCTRFDACEACMSEKIREFVAVLDIERTKLAACGVAAMQNTHDAKLERIDNNSAYWSASYGDVCDAVDREIELRDKVSSLEARCKRYGESLQKIADFDDCDCGDCMPCIAKHALEQREGGR